jgi:hypothetical protein
VVDAAEHGAGVVSCCGRGLSKAGFFVGQAYADVFEGLEGVLVGGAGLGVDAADVSLDVAVGCGEPLGFGGGQVVSQFPAESG